MLELPGYQTIGIIAETAMFVVFRGLRQRDQLPVIIKSLRNPYPSRLEVAQLCKEYELLGRVQSPHVIRAIELAPFKSWYALILEDINGQPLSSLAKKPVDFREFLPIAKAALAGLAAIHGENIIHKDLSSNNILINDAKVVKIIDFSIASELALERVSLDYSGIMEGSLPYMSPEQTGRINRDLDYRTDFYSLGICFFELLTGGLPFVADDALGFIHAHIAASLPSLRAKNPRLPLSLEQLVQRMTLKNPEERYQSVAGIQHDLAAIGAGLNVSIGAHDFSQVFTIPQDLVGREAVVQRLAAVHKRMARGTSEVIVLRGPSGIGKTSLVDALGQSIVTSHAFYAKGKFDQLQSNVPFSAVRSIFEQLFRQAAALFSSDVEQFKKRLRSTINDNWHIVKDLAPKIYEFCAPKDIGVAVAGVAGEVRNRNTLRELLRLFASMDHPLVLCFDDIQWADQETLTFLRDFLGHRLPYVLIILSYRDEEVGPAHFVQDYLNDFARMVPVLVESVGPLGSDSIREILSKSLRDDGPVVAKIADLILAKTLGNPFYVKELLRRLYQEDAIKPNAARTGWTLNLKKLEDMQISSNVVDFIVARMGTIDSGIKNVLTLAASIGHEFELRTLLVIANLPPRTLLSIVEQAVKLGFLLPVSGSYRLLSTKDLREDISGVDLRLRFRHDRLQQACYALIKPLDRPHSHLQIARQLAAEGADVAQTCRHYNLALALLDEASERRLVAKLNREMAVKARLSNAYQQLRSHAQAGLTMLKGLAALEHDSLERDLIAERMHAAFFLNEVSLAEALAKQVLARLDSKTDKADFYYTIGSYYCRLGMFRENIEAGIRGLALLGIKISEKVSIFTIAKELLTSEWYFRMRPIERLKRPTRERQVALAMKLFNQLQLPVAYAGNANMAFVMVLKAIIMAFRFGSPLEAGSSFATYGVARYVMFGKPAIPLKLVEISKQILHSGDDPYTLGQVLTVSAACILPNLKGFDELERTWESAVKEGYKAGDVNCIVSNRSLRMMHIMQNDLELALAEAQKCVTLARENNSDFHFMLNSHYYQVFNYLIDAAAPMDLSRLREATAQRYGTVPELIFRVLEMERLFITREFSELEANLAFAGKHIMRLYLAYPFFHLYVFYYVLTMIERAYVDPGKSRLLVWRAKRKLAWLKKPAKHAKDLECFTSILEAAISSLVDGPLVAMQKFRQALALSGKRFLKFEAIAAELGGRLAARHGLWTEAENLIKTAALSYEKWGSKRKVSQLGQEFAAWLGNGKEKRDSQPSLMRNSLSSPVSQSLSGSISRSAALDVPTFIKAAQDLAREVRIDRLASSLLHHAMENAGADHGYLLWRDIEGEDLKILVGGGKASIKQGPRRYTNDEMSPTIVSYCLALAEPLIVDNAKVDRRFRHDQYLQQSEVRSILCVPLMHQGKLNGLIYLENRLVANAFTEQRVAAMQMIAGLAAVSIENAKLYAELEMKIAARTVQVKAILANIKQGIFTVNQKFEIDEDYSVHLEQLTGLSDLKGLSFFEVFVNALDLDAEQKSLLEASVRSMLGEDLVTFSFNSHLLPREVYLQGVTLGENNKLGSSERETNGGSSAAAVKILEVDWSPIVLGDKVDRLLVSLRDVTRVRELEREASRQAARLTLLSEVMAVDESRFAEAFAIIARGTSACIKLLSEGGGGKELDRRLLTELHKMKGLARSLRLSMLSNAIHEAETLATPFQAGQGLVPLPSLLDGLHKVQEVQKQYLQIFDKRPKSGRQHLETADFGLTDEDLVHLISSAQPIVQGRTLGGLVRQIFCSDGEQMMRAWRAEAQELARSYGFGGIVVHGTMGGLWFMPRGRDALLQIMPQLLANSLAHGFAPVSSASSDGSCGAPPTIDVEGKRLSGRALLLYRDNGKGLDLEAIRVKASSLGLVPAGGRPENLAELVFLPQFSTRPEAGTLAGRGMGLSAVKALLAKDGGDIKVRLLDGSPMPRFELVLVLPASWYAEDLAYSWSHAS